MGSAASTSSPNSPTAHTRSLTPSPIIASLTNPQLASLLSQSKQCAVCCAAVGGNKQNSGLNARLNKHLDLQSQTNQPRFIIATANLNPHTKGETEQLTVDENATAAASYTNPTPTGHWPTPCPCSTLLKKLPPHIIRSLLTPSDFTYHGSVGKGGFGTVLKVVRKATGVVYAMKVQPKEYLMRSTKDLVTNKPDLVALYAEHTIMSSFVGHRGFVNLDYAFEYKNWFCMCMEMVDAGTMERMIGVMRSDRAQRDSQLRETTSFESIDSDIYDSDDSDNDPNGRLKSLTPLLSIASAKQIIRDLALALNHMHTSGVMCRDLKPPNVLMGSDGRAMLCDFGLTAKIRERVIVGDGEEGLKDGSDSDATYTQLTRKTICGTTGYRSVEMLAERDIAYSEREGYDGRSDLFVLGILSYLLIEGHKPFFTVEEMVQWEMEHRSESHDDSSLVPDGLSANELAEQTPDHSMAQSPMPPIRGVGQSAGVGGAISPVPISSKITVKEKGVVKDQERNKRKYIRDMEHKSFSLAVEFSPRYFDGSSIDFVSRLLDRNMATRMTFEEVASHDWMAGVSFDLLETEKELRGRDIIEYLWNNTPKEDIPPNGGSVGGRLTPFRGGAQSPSRGELSNEWQQPNDDRGRRNSLNIASSFASSIGGRVKRGSANLSGMISGLVGLEGDGNRGEDEESCVEGTYQIGGGGGDPADEGWEDGGCQSFMNVIDMVCDRFRKTKKGGMAETYIGRWREQVSSSVDAMFDNWTYISQEALRKELEVAAILELEEGEFEEDTFLDERDVVRSDDDEEESEEAKR